MSTVEGNLSPPDGQFAIVTARFNRPITSKLHEGALNTLLAHQVKEDNIISAWVPGSFELPVVAQEFALKESVKAVICLGVVIRGETPHFDFVADQAASGIQTVSLKTNKPVIFGVLTVNNLQQALDRIDENQGNKGVESALTAIEMVNLLKKLG